MREEKRVHHDHEHYHEGCGYGHEHHHDHTHEDEHYEHHDHEHHHEGCCCSHEHHHDHAHEHEHHAKSSKVNVPAGMKKTVYILENLGCANCAAKMERKINELPNVEEAVITYATKQLIIVGEHTENLLPEIQKICSDIEEEVRVIPKKETAPKKKRKKIDFC